MNLKNRKLDPGISFKDSPSLTHQEYKLDCDINEMIRRSLMGDLSGLRNGQYLDIRDTPTDCHTAANIIACANSAWHDMPDAVRASFGSVDNFVAYLNRPAEMPAEKPAEKPVETVPIRSDESSALKTT